MFGVQTQKFLFRSFEFKGERVGTTGRQAVTGVSPEAENPSCGKANNFKKEKKKKTDAAESDECLIKCDYD